MMTILDGPFWILAPAYTAYQGKWNPGKWNPKYNMHRTRHEQTLLRKEVPDPFRENGQQRGKVKKPNIISGKTAGHNMPKAGVTVTWKPALNRHGGINCQPLSVSFNETRCAAYRWTYKGKHNVRLRFVSIWMYICIWSGASTVNLPSHSFTDYWRCNGENTPAAETPEIES